MYIWSKVEKHYVTFEVHVHNLRTRAFRVRHVGKHLALNMAFDDVIYDVETLSHISRNFTMQSVIRMALNEMLRACTLEDDIFAFLCTNIHYNHCKNCGNISLQNIVDGDKPAN